MSYLDFLYEKFKNVKFEIVYFDNGSTPQSMQCYMLASNLDKGHLKDKGQTALDLGNYVYRRFGFRYEHGPEYHRKDEPANSLSFYQKKEWFQDDDNAHLREWILKHDETAKRPEFVLYDKRRLTIPHDPPYRDFVAIWKNTGAVVIFRKGMFQEIIFEAAGKDIKYLQAELGPESDFEIIGEL